MMSQVMSAADPDIFASRLCFDGTVLPVASKAQIARRLLPILNRRAEQGRLIETLSVWSSRRRLAQSAARLQHVTVQRSTNFLIAAHLPYWSLRPA
jgi:hypothetical protein